MLYPDKRFVSGITVVKSSFVVHQEDNSDDPSPLLHNTDSDSDDFTSYRSLETTSTIHPYQTTLTLGNML